MKQWHLMVALSLVACGSANGERLGTSGGDEMPADSGAMAAPDASFIPGPSPMTPSDTNVCPRVGDTRACSTETSIYSGIGICRQGMQRCDINGEFAEWSACVGEQLPLTETCDNGVDEDCDGAVDEDCEQVMPPTTPSDPEPEPEPEPRPEPEGECWGNPFEHELCRPYEASWYGPDRCPWAICKDAPDVAGSTCNSGNSSINGSWDEECSTCSSPPCRMYRTTVQNCSPANCR